MWHILFLLKFEVLFPFSALGVSFNQHVLPVLAFFFWSKSTTSCKSFYNLACWLNMVNDRKYKTDCAQKKFLDLKGHVIIESSVFLLVWPKVPDLFSAVYLESLLPELMLDVK